MESYVIMIIINRWHEYTDELAWFKCLNKTTMQYISFIMLDDNNWKHPDDAMPTAITTGKIKSFNTVGEPSLRDQEEKY